MQCQKIHNPADRASDETLRGIRSAPCRPYSEQTIRFMLRLIETSPGQYLAMVEKMTIAERVPLQMAIRERLELEAAKESKDV